MWCLIPADEVRNKFGQQEEFNIVDGNKIHINQARGEVTFLGMGTYNLSVTQIDPSVNINGNY